ncbi:MAG: neutral zinc metallopeptidase [Bacteroidales bacterium]|nr:neutral zinc metallopeptidase [Bacteroidales bacterium]
MKLDGRRESTNVDDRRGRGGMVRTAGGLGIGGVIIVGLITLLMGGDLGDVVNNVQSMGGVGGGIEQTQVDQTQFTAEEQELARFSRQILAGTEDVWTKIFAEQGWGEYQAPTLVLFSGAVQSGCGGATSSSGPFYCSADHCVYLDLSFFSSMKKQLGADGDFAYAYVIAHEVGHHVQYLLGILGDAHKKMSQTSQTESNKISVRLELQADFFAGIWGYYDNALFGSLEMGDVEEGLNVASKIGDDYLQKKARGYSVPDSFNHGTSAQRSKWLKKGLTTGNVQLGDTFSPAYNTL